MGGPGGPSGTNVTIDEPVEDYDPTSSVWKQPETQWIFYPNPAQSQITVQGLAAPTRFQIYDASGRMVGEQTLTERQPWSIHELSSGSYVIASENGVRKSLHIIR